MPYIEMPKLSDTMAEGTVVKWRKAVGDPVNVGNIIAEIETDKAVMELEAFDEGTLKEIYIGEGGTAQIGQKLALLLAPGESAPQNDGEADKTEKAGLAVATQSRAASPKAKANNLNITAPTAGSRVKASPLAKKIAVAKGVSLSSIQGSGPGGRIVARDVESASAVPTSASPVVVPVTPAGQGSEPALPTVRPPQPFASSFDPVNSGVPAAPVFPEDSPQNVPRRLPPGTATGPVGATG